MSENNQQREEVFSKAVRAGKRTYFFDVKSTKANDFYLTITESKKRIGDNGTPFFEKHKIFLYREDFQKFSDGLLEAIEHVGTLKPEDPNGTSFEHRASKKDAEASPSEPSSPYSDVNFDDLG
ncbi:MAG TPA: DUF3276 family protein [Bacteroidia bacterium]|nr:DUF3276 family protein [Bacteroidia bacterium]HNS11873.1 DUF3276 family protein [Bacteroidia bacterium]